MDDQNLLEKWLNIQPSNINIKTVFYLYWENEKPNNAIWLSKVPEKINFSVKVKWKEINKDINVCGYIDNFENNFNLPIEHNYKNLSMIKSHLQKAIRRMDDNLAIQSAWIMIKMDLLAFIRRIMIIMIEDVYLHESFGVLQWLLCAISSGLFRIQENHIKWLLGIVHMLSLYPIKDFDSNNDKSKNILENLNKKFLECSEYQYSLLYSILFRASYGGMKGDKDMLINNAMTWYNRFLTNREYDIRKKIRMISLKILPLEREYWILASIDFHCCPYILKWLQDKYPDFSQATLKSIIWHNSSKINNRVSTKPFDKDWFIIEKDLVEMQRYIINKYA